VDIEHFLNILLRDRTFAKPRSESLGYTSISDYDGRHVLPCTGVYDLHVYHCDERAYHHNDCLWNSHCHICATRAHKCLCIRARIYWSVRLHGHPPHYPVCGFLLLCLFQSNILGSELVDLDHFDGLSFKLGVSIKAQRGFYVLLFASTSSTRIALPRRYHHFSGSSGSVDNFTVHRCVLSLPKLRLQLRRRLLYRESHRGR